VKRVLNTFNDTLSAVNRWKPSQQYTEELNYRDDLFKYLKKEINSTAPYTYMPREKISVLTQEAAGYCDINVEQRAVGIKIKKDLLEKSDVDRLIGQLAGYKSGYDDIIVVLVGKTDEKAFEHLKSQLSTIIDTRYTAQQRIKIIRKDKT
jgi:hypothetical protein